MRGAPRRETDSGEEDFTSSRRGDSSHTKWVIGIVSATIVSLAGWGIINDRNTVERRLEQLDKRVEAVETLALTAVSNQAIQAERSRVQWDEVQRTLAEIKIDLKDVKREVKR